MGSNFLTKAEAAAQLGKTQRSVLNYVKSGFLRTERDGRRLLLNPQDVKELAVTLGKDMPPMNRKNFWHLQHRFERLEQDHKAIKEKLGLTDTPFRPDAAEAMRLWDEATAAAALASPLPYPIAEAWVTTIMRVDEKVLGMLGSGMPALPFLTILNKLDNQVAADPMLPKSIGLQALRVRLALARRRLKEALLVWHELGEVQSPKQKLLLRRQEMEAKKKTVRSRDKK